MAEASSRKAQSRPSRASSGTASNTTPSRAGAPGPARGDDVNSSLPSPESRITRHSGNALGMVETVGLVGAIDAGDAMVKAANVELVGHRVLRSGQVTVAVRGDVGAVQAAIAAGREVARQQSSAVWTQIIARPDAELEAELREMFH